MILGANFFDEFGTDFLNDLDGIFSFCLYDPETKDYFIARDHIGIIPLYIGWDKNGVTYVASEMKAIEPFCEKMQELHKTIPTILLNTIFLIIL